MPKKKATGKHRMRQLEFVESPPLNTPWRPTTPSRSCLCPVTADVVDIDQAGRNWISPHFEQLLATSGKQVRKKRHVATVPLISDANTSVRTAVSRRVQFPPLQFVSEGVITAKKPFAIRSHISEDVQPFCSDNYTSTICLQSDNDHEVCLEHVEKEVQTGTVEDLQSIKQHRMTDTEACCGRLTIIDSDESTRCPPLHLNTSCCKADDDAAVSNCLPAGMILAVNDKDLTLAEQSPNLSQKQDLTVCAENTSAVHFDINTPSCELEPSDFSQGQKLANEVVTETETCQNVPHLADCNSVEPLRVLSFSRLERSLDATEDPVERVICAAELKENMSELPEKDDETFVSDHVDGQRSFFLDKLEFFSTLNSLTPLENRSNYTVLVSDTPVSDYDLSYRQRALKAGNIRLRYRTRKS